jgi:hypothetical protein
MGCPTCEPFANDIRIESMPVLDKLIESVARAIREGKLVVDDGSPRWDDTISCDLHCATCATRFEFRADTYHGRGGYWRVV